MTEEKEIESGELVVIKEVDIPALFKRKGCDPIIEGLKKKAAEFEGDISTAKGRKAIASFAGKFSTSKVYIDKLGKALTDKLRDDIAPIQAERNKIKACCDELRDKIRKPLTDWEDAEKKRVADIEARINEITRYGEGACSYESSIRVKIEMDALKNIPVDESFEEFELAATKAKEASLTQLEAKFIVLQDAEKKKAEAERLEKERLEKERIEREEKIARESAEKAKQEAEEKAKAEAEEKERLAKESIERAKRKTLKAKEDKAKAEREKTEVIERAERKKKEAAEKVEQDKRKAAEKAEKDKQQAIDDEKKRQADQIKADEEAEEKRQANKKHRKKISKEVSESLRLWFVASVLSVPSEDEVESLVEAIIDGRIKNTNIIF
ncbi:hypothetical protein KAR91_52620 [Candidatus Pacearchaeota archaeon]|nr:hypothetical protein [Candidatus Pacearchaeota archaeon]